MSAELKQRKAVVQRKRVRPTESARPEEVQLIFDKVLLFFILQE